MFMFCYSDLKSCMIGIFLFCFWFLSFVFLKSIPHNRQSDIQWCDELIDNLTIEIDFGGWFKLLVANMESKVANKTQQNEKMRETKREKKCKQTCDNKRKMTIVVFFYYFLMNAWMHGSWVLNVILFCGRKTVVTNTFVFFFFFVSSFVWLV